MNRIEPIQGNTVSADALEQMQTTIEGIAILVDSLIFSNAMEGTPVNIDSVRRLISGPLDEVAEGLHTIVNAACGKEITISNEAEQTKDEERTGTE